VSIDFTVPLKTACATGGNAHPSGTVVAATGSVVVVVVVVVVVTTGFTQPTIGIVVTDGSTDGGHTTGTVVVDDVVVVAPVTADGDIKNKAIAAANKVPVRRRIFSTLVIFHTPLSSQSQQY
jgi:hypothetical protein